MSRRHAAVLVVAATTLAVAVATAVAAPPTGFTRTELARSTIADPFAVEATEASDIAIQTIRIEPGSGTGGWHSHPGATFVAVKSGTLTLYRGDGDACTSRSYSAGEGFLEPADDVHLAQNEGAGAVELVVTVLAVPVGAPLRTAADSPGGTGCPS